MGLIGAGLVGAAALGIGFGLAAHYKQSDADGRCGLAAGFGNANACTAEGLALDRAAQTYRTAAYWSIGLGAATAVVGGALLIPWRTLFGKSAQAGSPGFSVLPVVGREASGLSIQTAW
jgi:hypothetical protein